MILLTARILAISLLMLLSMRLDAYCRSSANELSKIITDSKILPPHAKINIAVEREQALVVSYARDNSNDRSKDCKIDAVLIAKALFKGDPELSRVTTRFYDAKRSNYLEISVTVGDVKAFGSGELSSEKLLSSLEVKSVNVAVSVPSPTSATKESDKSLNSTGPAADRSISSYDIAFSYPKDWVNKENGKEIGAGIGEQVIAKLTNSRTAYPAVITVSRFKHQPAISLLRQGEAGLLANGFVNVDSKRRTTAGTNGKLNCPVLIGYKKTPIGQLFFERVFVETSSSLFTVTLDGGAQERLQSEKDLSSLLFSIHAASNKTK